MKRFLLAVFLFSGLISCKNETESNSSEAIKNETLADSTNESQGLDLAYIDSEYLQASKILSPFEKDLEDFEAENYSEVKEYVFERSIPEIQQAVADGKITYEAIVKFYLMRISEYDRDNNISLNSIIALNPDIIKQARQKDALRDSVTAKNMMFGIPVLLKDNINAEGMATTAGAAALEKNYTSDAFIVQKLKEKGALILGKANLSEWANYFCDGCPNGFSTIGGQTLNPYGRKRFDTGGSSSGSGVAIAANLAPVAIGSETAGSILSPSSQNSVVGLKPTVGLLSRGGIVPISSTLDTPGPMTKFVVDNAILLSALTGTDSKDPASQDAPQQEIDYYAELDKTEIKGKKFGYYKMLLENKLYAAAVDQLKSEGAELVELEMEQIPMNDFTRLLDLDMRKDLPDYLKNYGGEVEVKDVQDVITYNRKDSLKRSPYGQKIFEGIVADSASEEEYKIVKDSLNYKGLQFLEKPMNDYQLDAILSINNYFAAYAAVAKFPAITVPMGYDAEGEPAGLTFIGHPFSEADLLKFAYAYEKMSEKRQTPPAYDE